MLTQKGFTLIELMVTVFIVAIVFAYGAPNYRQFIDNRRRTANLNELLVAINLARSEAIKRNRHITICKSANGTSCGGNPVNWAQGWITYENTASANFDTLNAGEEILAVGQGYTGQVTITPDAPMANRIAYRPTGRSRASGTLIWCDQRGAAQARAITISATGRPRVSTTTLGGGALTCP